MRLASIELGSFFFEPLQFHLESTDLFVQLRLACHMLLQVALRMAVKDIRSRIKQLLLPGADLVGVDTVLAGDLVDGLESSDRFQRDRELELTAELPPLSAHFNASTSFRIVTEST